MPKKKGTGKINTRMVRINDEIAREAANIIRFEMADPRVSTVVSVLRAETTADLKYCKIYVSMLGDEKQQKELFEALKSAAGFIRKRIAETIDLRNTPELTFVFDDSIEYAMRMYKLIDDVNRGSDENK